MFAWMKNVVQGPYRWFEKMVSPGDDLGVKQLFVLLVVAALMVGIVFVADILITFGGEPEGNASHGVFGDFFGGVVNPLLTFLTFFGLLITIVLQKAELRETRKELAKSASALDEQVKQLARQSNVAGFYKLIDNHMSLVSSIDLVNTEGVKTVGRDCMRVFRNRLSSVFRNNVRWDDDGGPRALFQYRAKDPKSVQKIFGVFWQEEGEELQPYMASVRITLSYLESQLEFDCHLVGMYRSLFTDSERMLIFYYALVLDDDDFSRQLSVTGFCIGIHSSFLLLGEHEYWLSECRIPQT